MRAKNMTNYVLEKKKKRQVKEAVGSKPTPCFTRNDQLSKETRELLQEIQLLQSEGYFKENGVEQKGRKENNLDQRRKCLETTFTKNYSF